MALDNAQFPSELSIVDPPGTDPLSEGDDQIRTAKRVVFQGFGNVDKAVTKTADQMNDGAQRSELNTFADVQTFAARIDANANFRFDNTAVDRGFQWSNAGNFTWELLVLHGSDDSMHFRRFNAGLFVDTPLIIDNAFGRATFSALAIFEQEIRAGDGTASFPSHTFGSDPTAGMFLGGVNVLAFGTQGVARLNLTASQVQTVAPLEALATVRFFALESNPTTSGTLYAKQSQLFAGTELVVGITP